MAQLTQSEEHVLKIQSNQTDFLYLSLLISGLKSTQNFNLQFNDPHRTISLDGKSRVSVTRDASHVSIAEQTT